LWSLIEDAATQRIATYTLSSLAVGTLDSIAARIAIHAVVTMDQFPDGPAALASYSHVALASAISAMANATYAGATTGSILVENRVIKVQRAFVVDCAALGNATLTVAALAGSAHTTKTSGPSISTIAGIEDSDFGAASITSIATVASQKANAIATLAKAALCGVQTLVRPGEGQVAFTVDAASKRIASLTISAHSSATLACIAATTAIAAIGISEAGSRISAIASSST
jgi:hypothetical protein